jgi:hypothetical protein
MNKIIWYKANDKIFGTVEDAEMELMEANPGLLDDDMPDFFDSHIEEIEGEE